MGTSELARTVIDGSIGMEGSTPRGDSTWAVWLRFLGVLVAVGLCGGAQWYIRNGLRWGEASALLVGGAVAAAVLLGRPAPLNDVREGPTTFSPPGRIGIAGIVMSIVGIAAFSLASYLLTADWKRYFDLAAPLAVASVAFCGAGLAVRDRRCHAGQRRAPMLRWERWLLVAIVAFGFFLRFYRYDYFPPPDGVCAVEEPQAGQATHLILHEGARPWEFAGDRWLAVPFFALMGETLTALRIPFTLVSGLTVLALYLLLRQLVSRPAALFATALAAMCSWNLIYARLAHNIFATTIIVVIVLSLCMRAHRRGGLAPYPWIGFLSAYTLYTYAGFRGTSLFVGIALGFSFLLRLRAWRNAVAPQTRMKARRVLAEQLIGFALLAVMFVGTAVPLIPRLGGENSGYFLEAANRSLINGEYYTADLNVFIPRFIRRVRSTAMLFNHAGDGSETFNLPNEPMLEPVSGVLFMLGLAYCLVWGRHRWQGFFALVFLTLVTFGTVLVGNFDPRRLQGIVPFIFVLIAFFADRLAAVATARLGSRGRPALIGLALVVMGLAFYKNYDVYFRRMMNDPRVRTAFQSRYTVAVPYFHSLPPDAYLLFVSEVFYFFSESDLSWIRGDGVPGNVTGDLLPLFLGQPGPWAGHDLRVLIETPYEHEEIARLLQARFPGAVCQDVSHPDSLYHRMSACQIPPGALAGGFQGGVHARYFRADAPEPFLERDEPAISLAFMPSACHFPVTNEQPPCRVEWEGSWEVSAPGLYELSAEARQGEITVNVDGTPLQPVLTLGVGPHVLRAQARFRQTRTEIEDAGARLRWRKRGARNWDLIQFARFDAGTEHQ